MKNENKNIYLGSNGECKFLGGQCVLGILAKLRGSNCSNCISLEFSGTVQGAVKNAEDATNADYEKKMKNPLKK